MNTLQLLGRIGNFKMADVDGGAFLVEQLVGAMPEDIHIDIDMTADEIMDVYREQPNDVKRNIGRLSIQDSAVIIDIVEWLNHTETRQRDMIIKEDGVRNIQLMAVLAFSCFISLWSAYCYYQKASTLLGDQYHSSLTDFVINIHKVITSDPGAPPDNPPPQQ